MVELSLVLFFAPGGFSPGTPIFPFPQEPKKKNNKIKYSVVVDEEPLYVDVLPLNQLFTRHFLLFILDNQAK